MSTIRAHARLLGPSLLAAALLAWGCTGGEPGPGEGDRAAEVVARVAGSPITAQDVDLLARRTLGVDDPLAVGGQTRERLVESLVKSRAMAVQAEQTLTRAELAEIERKTAAFREELLVDGYIRRSAGFTPITTGMIREYYVSHPGEFGGRKVKTFEYVTSGAVPNEQTRDRVIGEMGGLATVSDWKRAVDGLPGLGLAWRRASLPEDMLEEPLKSLVEKTSKGRVSELFMGEEIVIVRVLDEIEQPARPLEEVSAEIRKKLAPVVMKDVIEKASAEALSRTEVVYVGER